MPVFSPDGYLRLPRCRLERIALQHLMSGMDEEPASANPHCGSAVTLCGYTEWVSPAEPALSIGWDWAWQSTPAGGGIVRQGLPRTNVLLVSDTQVPLPIEESLEMVARFIDAIDWQRPAWQAAFNAPLPA
jgi:hypothetical protein